ncbi:MAG: helix-turn-helix transcriptional regulator [Spirochaetales bacterium]|nr:helix-turn-helix transcriptional regulator [Spirochaetales bacterium]
MDKPEMYEDKLLKEILVYIDTHLQEELSLGKISDAICYSEEYTSRFFKKMTGINLFDYIRKKRLVLAAADLQKNNNNILELALNYGFNSHEGFTRAFTSHFGLSPKEFRKVKPGKALFMPLVKKLGAIKEFTMKSIVVFTQVIERPKRKFIYLKGKKATHYFEYCEEVGCDIWERLLKIKPALYEPVGAWLPENLRPADCSEYVQGIEVAMDFPGVPDKDLSEMVLEPAKYLVFQSSPYECDEDDKTMMEVISKIQDDIKNYNPELYGFVWAKDAGPRFQLAPLAERGYIEGLPVRMKN